MTTKLAIFADVQNIYYTTREAYGRQFDYRRLWQTASVSGDVVTAYAYATERGDESQQKFQHALRQIGFTVRLKPYIRRADGSAKGDWDVGITIDVLETASEVDRIILLSGDGDFEVLVEKIKRYHGVHVTVCGVPALTAQSLIDAADEFMPIDEQSGLLKGR